MKIVKQIILAFIILVSSIATAQNDNKKLSDEDKIRLVNTIGGYCLQTSINQEKKSDDTAVPKEYISLEEFQKENLSDYSDNSKTMELYKDFIKLRENVNKLESAYFEEKIFTDKNYKSFKSFFEKKNREDNYKKDLEALKKVSTKTSEEVKEEEVKEEEVKGEKAKGEKVKGEKAKAEKGGIPFIYVFLISVLAFLAGFIGSKFIKKNTAVVEMKDGRPTSQSAYMSDEVGDTDERNETLVSESENVKSNSSFSKLKEDYKNLEKAHKSLQKKYDELILTNDNLMNDSPDRQEENKVLASQPIATVSNKKYFYYAPDNGIFTAESKESDAVYFLEEKSNGGVAFELNINDKSTFSTLIFSISEYIYSGCSSENSPNEETKDIRIIEQGEAIKTNEGWKITKKCKIEFI